MILHGSPEAVSHSNHRVLVGANAMGLSLLAFFGSKERPTCLLQPCICLWRNLGGEACVLAPVAFLKSKQVQFTSMARLSFSGLHASLVVLGGLWHLPLHCTTLGPLPEPWKLPCGSMRPAVTLSKAYSQPADVATINRTSP